MVEHYETNPDWAEVTAMSLISTLAGRRYYIKTDKSEMTFLNTMFIGIAPSRYGNKSVSLTFIREVLSQIDAVDLKLPSIKMSSIEGLIGILEDRPYGLIYEDEVASSFLERDYKKGMDEFLSQLYDGYIDGRITKKHGLVKGFETYTNFIGAGSLIFFKKVSNSMFEQGLGNRILWVRWGDIERSLTQINADKKRLGFNDIVNFFVKLFNEQDHMTPRICMEFAPNSLSLLVAKAREYDKIAMKLDEYNAVRGVYAESNLYMRKFAALRAISQGREGITVKDVTWAIIKMEFFINQFKTIISEWSGAIGMQPLKTNKTMLDNIMVNATMLSEDHDNFQFGNLLAVCNIQNSDLHKTLSTLIESERLVELSKSQKETIPKDKRNGWSRVSSKVYSLDLEKYPNELIPEDFGLSKDEMEQAQKEMEKFT